MIMGKWIPDIVITVHNRWMPKWQYHLNVSCSFNNNDQWLTLLECPFLEFHPNKNVTYNITRIVDTTLVQYHPINLHILNIARILHYPCWAFECQPPCLCFMETVVPHILLITKTHHEHPFTMTIISSLSSRTASPPICHIKKSAQGTKISSSHNYVWQYIVSLFLLFLFFNWSGMHSNVDLTVLYTMTSTTVPDNRGIYGILRYFVPKIPLYSIYIWITTLKKSRGIFGLLWQQAQGCSEYEFCNMV